MPSSFGLLRRKPKKSSSKKHVPVPQPQLDPSNPRIPLALQQVFLASQRGEEVHQAPKSGIGFKMFVRPFGRWNRKHKAARAPTASSLNGERSHSKSSAADATRRTMRNASMTSSTSVSSAASSIATMSNPLIGKAASPPKEVSTATATATSPEHRRPTTPKSNMIDANDPPPIPSPQVYLDQSIQARGYSIRKYCSLEGGYYCRPTPLQQASYGTKISGAIRQGDASLLRRLLDSGLSPNPCNNFGESLVHMVCRRGDHRLLRILLEAGCSLQVTDDYGRTPLHDACWRATPSFETVKLILESDKHLLHLLDCRGAAPMSYIKKENYGEWIEFLRNHQDRFWPVRDIGTEGDERPPPLTLRQPHSLPIPDPRHALPLEVAAMVSNGRMEPEEALYLDDSDSDDDSDDDDDDSSFDSDEDSDDDDVSSSYDSDDESSSSYDEEEMREFCLRAGGPMAVAKLATGGR